MEEGTITIKTKRKFTGIFKQPTGASLIERLYAAQEPKTPNIYWCYCTIPTSTLADMFTCINCDKPIHREPIKINPE